MAEPLTFPSQQPAQCHYVHELGETRLSMPWFVGSTAVENGQKAFIARAGCVVQPLINGAETFGALEKSIRAAKQTIDYVTWGFDPSMRFTDGGQCIGDILLEKAKTVKVRILVWYGGYLSSALLYRQSDEEPAQSGQNIGTSNLPGWDELPGQKSLYVTSGDWYEKIKKVPNIQFVKRSLNENEEAYAFEKANRHLDPPTLIHELGMKVVATHHQKMVLIDYGNPPGAVGFVLGSNTLPRYWDTNEHPIHHDNRRIDYIETVKDFDQVGRPQERMRPSSIPLAPWQDVSSRVQGELLFDLNVNFSRAWTRAGGKALEPERQALKPSTFNRSEGRPAQIVRTQPQEKDITISDAYFQNVLNARKYIYFENPYFRLPELMKGLATMSQRLCDWGRKESLYLFVVTNVPPDEHGRMNTYQMLSVLGHSEQMPRMQADASVAKQSLPPLAATKGGDQAGLQTVVCTLTANEGKTYLPIYTHSKLMIIDDVFYTLGSANLNKRSMVSDSEINVSVPDPAAAKQLRTRLWHMHRGAEMGMTVNDFAKEFRTWSRVAKANLKQWGDKSNLLEGRLTLFMDKNPAVSRADD